MVKHIVWSNTSDLQTPRDLAAFIGNNSALTAEDAITLAGAMIREGWVSVIVVDAKPLTGEPS